MTAHALSRTGFVGVALLAGLAAVGGCSGGDGKTAGSASTGHSEQASAAAPARAAAGTASAASVALQQKAQRVVVRTASMSVTASNVDAAAARVDAIAVEQGGRVEGDERSGTGSGRTATLVVRVLPARLETAMTVVGSLGKETQRSLQATDVTETTVDLGARTAALVTSVARLRHLLGTSGSVSGLLAVEKQLSSREAELESLQAQKTSLANQVSLAALTVSLTSTTPPAVMARTGLHPTGFVSALGSGVHAVVVGLRLAAAGLGYSLPVLVLLAALSGLGWRFWRRSRPPLRTPPPAQAASVD